MRGEFKQLRDSFYVPVGIVGRGVAQIGRQFDHLAGWVLARAVPIDDRSRGKGMAEVVDARPPSVSIILLRPAQSDALAYRREVISGGTVPHSIATAGDEEGRGRKTQQAISLGRIGSETCDDAFRERDQPLLAQFSAADAQHPRVKIDVGVVEGDGLSDPQAGNRYQAEHRRAGETPHAVNRGQLGGRVDDRGDFRGTIDVRSHAPVAVRDNSSRQGLIDWIKSVQPLREKPNHARARGPSLSSRTSERFLPTEEQGGRHVLRLLALGEVDEAAQHPLGCRETIAQAASDGQVTIEFVTEVHRASPATGQGCAIDRRPSISSFA